MAKASTLGELNELHSLITKAFRTRLEDDLRDQIPTDAATLGAAIKFLKDNAVTADPADVDDLQDLRQKLVEQAQSRRERMGSALALVQDDLLAAEG